MTDSLKADIRNHRSRKFVIARPAVQRTLLAGRGNLHQTCKRDCSVIELGTKRDNCNPMKQNNYFIYIMTNQDHTVLYTGVTNDLQRRIIEHKQGKGGVFSKKYKL